MTLVTTEETVVEEGNIVVEEKPQEILPINTIWELPKEKTLDDVPDNPNPFYILAKEGVFLRKATALGFGTILMDNMPRKLGELGFPKGVFQHSASRVPPEICSQVVDFFRRIWDKHKAEAEVILTARIEVEKGLPVIKEWRVFVPTQKVSGGGVESVYDPTHIAKGHQVVGTIHSHCNFSAYHSGTDTNDARGMDGLHMTIGYVDSKNPEVAAMIVVNGMRVDYEWKVVADFSQLNTVSAPKWWDNYVLPSQNVRKESIAGIKNFDKFKATGHGNSGYSEYAWGDTDGYYGHYRGGYGKNNLPPIGNKTPNWRSTAPETTHSKTIADLVREENKDDKKDTRLTQTDMERLMRESEAAYWEDSISPKLRDLLFDNNLLNDDDIDDLIAQKDDKEAIQFLTVLLLKKTRDAKDALNLLGVDVKVVVNKPKQKKGPRKK